MKFSVSILDFDRSNTKDFKAENIISFPNDVGAGDSGLWFYHTINKEFYGWDGTDWIPFSGGTRALKISETLTAPTSEVDTGIRGEVRYDVNYVYICVDTNVWTRAAITPW